MLESEYRVSCANSVGEARAFLQTAHFDAVLIDNILPDGRGDGIANIAQILGTPVVEMTGYPIEMTSLERCSHPYLMKPFGVARLLSTIESVLKS